MSISVLPSYEVAAQPQPQRHVAFPDLYKRSAPRVERPTASQQFHQKSQGIRNAWSEEEHERFLDGVERFGRDKPTKIAEFLGSRSSSQVISHSQKTFERFGKDIDALLHGQLHVDVPKLPPFDMDPHVRAEMEREFCVPAFQRIQIVDVVDVPRVAAGVLLVPQCLLQTKLPMKLLRKSFYVVYNQTQRPLIAAQFIQKRFDISAIQTFVVVFGAL